MAACTQSSYPTEKILLTIVNSEHKGICKIYILTTRGSCVFYGSRVYVKFYKVNIKVQEFSIIDKES
jgi:hypothetical protein